jgi:F-type H+-transporting ATPase subunit gamma
LIKFTFEGVAKNAPSWVESATVADILLQSKTPFDAGSIIYNQFKSVIAFEASKLPVYTSESLKESGEFYIYSQGKQGPLGLEL